MKKVIQIQAVAIRPAAGGRGRTAPLTDSCHVGANCEFAIHELVAAMFHGTTSGREQSCNL
jgi:hypothetical protein